MAGPNDFTGQNIQDTYQRVLQISSSGQITDGTGSLVSITATTASHALFAVSASHEITFELSSSHAQTADFLTPGNDINVRHITASGNISASGDIIANRYFLQGTRVLSNSGTEIQINETSLPIHINGPSIGLEAPVTASGNISASGNLIGNIDGGSF